MDDIKLLKICIVIAFILLGAMICLYMFQDKGQVQDDASEEFVTIENPISEVSSLEEMKKYLGFDVPVIEGKEIKSYIVIGEDKKATHARIIYIDESSFDMEKVKDKDVSGIYGGKLSKIEKVGDKEVSLYTMEDIKYGIWSDSEYSYSYSILKGKLSDVIKDINLFK